MSQRDLVAELRAAHLTAPPELRERVRLIAVEERPASRRVTWRRALVVAVPVAAAVAAAIVFTRPAHQPSADRSLAPQTLNSATQHGAAPGAAAPAAPAPSAKAFTVPSTAGRVQQYGATLGLRL